MNLEHLKQELYRVDEAMDSYVCDHIPMQTLKESMLYSIHAGGKRIRPLLVMASAYLYHHPIDDDVIQVAASLEMIHTYSLIHDDLPAMDDDDFRRGKLTNHKQFNEATAILAGDALLTDAFYIISTLNIDPLVKLQLIQSLSMSAGGQGMVSGQMMDMDSEKKTVSLEYLKQIHAYKTGALFEYALTAGAYLSQQPVDDMKRLGAYLGLAFQIRDDILDIVSTKEALGKTPHKDEKAQKSTYPKLLTLKGSYEALDELLMRAKQLVMTIDIKRSQPLVELIESLRLTKEQL